MNAFTGQLRGRCAWTIGLASVVVACEVPSARTPVPAASSDSDWPPAAKVFVTKGAQLQTTASKNPLLDVMDRQLKRSFAVLSEQEYEAYLLRYQVTDKQDVVVAATDGELLRSNATRSRLLDVDVRVGSYQLDQTRSLPGEMERGGYQGVELLPIDKGSTETAAWENATQNGIWLATNRAYDAARERFMLVSQHRERAQGREDRDAVASYTPAVPVTRYEPLLELDVERQGLERMARELSRLAVRHARVMSSGVTLDVGVENKFLVTSEGTQTQTSQSRVRLSLSAGAVASDGLLVGQFDSIEVRHVDDLPSLQELSARYEQVLTDVDALLDAPLVDPYVGPAILDGKAAGVFFHEVFGHRIEGHRQDADNEGQTFSGRIGERVMPAFLSIYDDPTVASLNGVELSGFYSIDDEGVLGQRANLVEDGVLRDFLMSREPTKAIVRSNGHGRRSPGHQIVARQANLFVEPATVVSPETLKQALLEEVRQQGLEFGLRFSQISGGYTQTARYDTQAFKVMPVMVYRVYLDGREELVRGVDIEGTPLTALSKIALAANDFQVFNGVCGAESGWVPVSAVSPSLLVSQIEVARQELSEARPPILPSPKLEARRHAPTPTAAEGRDR